MKYTLMIKKQVKRKLQKMPMNDRIRIVEKIEILGNDPDDVRLDIKKLVGYSRYRLRVGDWRVIFDRQDMLKIIAIEKLKSRGEVYR